jgi:MoaA/NifB/PqqE/SkfB family radical SAM enzyme
MDGCCAMAMNDLPATAILPGVGESQQIARLPVLVLHVHSSCNCRCRMCDIWKTLEAHSLEPRAMEPHLASLRGLGVRWIVFTGGEPLLNRDYPELCAMLRREGIRLTLLTTGLLMQREARQIADSFDDAIVSLDGPAEIHDAIRQVPGGFGRIRAGIAAIREIEPDFPVTARSTVQKANFRYLRQTVQCAKSLGLRAVSFLAVDLTSAAFGREATWHLERQNEIGLSLPDLGNLEFEIEALIRENLEDIRSGFIAESPEKLRRILAHFRTHLGLEKPASPSCNAPWTSAVVEIDGTVRPCFFQPPIGNLRDGGLPAAINSARALQFRKALNVATNPICNRCVCSLNYRD